MPCSKPAGLLACLVVRSERRTKNKAYKKRFLYVASRVKVEQYWTERIITRTGRDKMEQQNELLRTEAAAQHLGVSQTTLTTWRCVKRYALPYLKVGSKVYYRRSDLDQWLESRTVRGGGRRRGR